MCGALHHLRSGRKIEHDFEVRGACTYSMLGEKLITRISRAVDDMLVYIFDWILVPTYIYITWWISKERNSNEFLGGFMECIFSVELVCGSEPYQRISRWICWQIRIKLWDLLVFGRQSKQFGWGFVFILDFSTTQHIFAHITMNLLIV